MGSSASDGWTYGEALWPLGDAAGAARPLVPRDAVSQPRILPAVLDPARCEALVQAALEIDPEHHSGIERPGGRCARSHWIFPTPQWTWLYERVSALFAEANRGFDFHIDRLVDPLLVAEYPEGPGFDWHLDTVTGVTSTRKISLTIPLTAAGAYEGGDLEIAPYGTDADARVQGNAVLFPSFLCHRVHPVRQGRRRALVAWAHGPAFR